MLDLDAYFSRIGFTGPRTATVETLHALQALHPAAIPFENLDPLLGRPVALDLEALQRKLVRSRRGGYCFEHNTLFKAVLDELGFRVGGLAARVMWMAPPGRPTNPRTHMLLRVALAGADYLVDVGFGGCVVGAPLELIAEREQPTPTGRMRLMRDEAVFTLQSAGDAVWHDVYRFSLEPQLPIDYELANWYTATHPNSHFTSNLVIERWTPNVRTGLLNRRLRRRFPDGQVDERVIATPAELARILDTDLDLEPPVDPATIFSRLPAAEA